MAYKDNGFTQIPNWYWQCGLSLLEVNIIARVGSWQRANKKSKKKYEFFESYEAIADLFQTHRHTVRKAFNKLEKQGILSRNGKKGRTWKWKVMEYNLEVIHNKYNQSTNNPGKVQQEYNISTPDVHYNTNQTSNKTSLIERGSNEDPLSREEIGAWLASTEIDI